MADLQFKDSISFEAFEIAITDMAGDIPSHIDKLENTHLFYIGDVHVGTWENGTGWIFTAEHIATVAASNALIDAKLANQIH